MNISELMLAIRKLHFGFAIFTDGDVLFKFSLFDWDMLSPDNVVWESDAGTLHALLTQAYMLATKYRETLPVS
jgi:hypothetical protein